MASDEGPESAITGPTLAFASNGASATGSVDANALHDALTSGVMREWEWVGADLWSPFDAILVNPGVPTANGITAGSEPTMACRASMAPAAGRGGTLSTRRSGKAIYVLAGRRNDMFRAGVTVRHLTQQSKPIYITFPFLLHDYRSYRV